MPVRHWGHYNQWLQYGYLQQGRYREALELLQAAYEEAKADGKAPVDRMDLDPDDSLVGSVVSMWARYIIETRQWDSELATWSFNSGDAFDPNLNIFFIRAMHAAYSGLAAQSDQYIDQFRKLRLELDTLISRQEEQSPTDLLYLDRLAVMELELQAAREYARGELAQAARLAGEAVQLEGEMPFSFGPPFVDLPAAEYLGDLLLESRKYADAVTAYELQLERTRQKSRSLLGLVRALTGLEKETDASYTRAKLDRIWSGADEAVKQQQ
jgi:tetratricopeptide (TPR) repeat protein